MPVGVYRKKNKKGKFMYFRDGKLISKKSYDASMSRRSTRKGQVRKTARRAYVRKNNKRSNSKMKRTIPHPSVTGMASGLAIASYLNAGRTTSTATGTSMGTVTTMGEGVLKDITDGELGTAFNTLAGNAVGMIASEGGRKTLVTAGGVALLGAFARKQFPNLKLGGSKFYFRL
jgi:hypothetical protein